MCTRTPESYRIQAAITAVTVNTQGGPESRPLASAQAPAPADSGEGSPGPRGHGKPSITMHSSNGQGAPGSVPGLHMAPEGDTAEGSRPSRTGARHIHV